MVDALVEQYHRASRGDEAVNLCWRVHEARPSPAGYRRISENASRAGVWAHWRDRSLSVLRRSVQSKIAADAHLVRRPAPWAAYATAADASDLVEVFLFEGDVEQAWTEAQAGGCSTRWWTELARLREADHPSDAIPIWQREVERAIAQKSNPGCQEAVELMARVRRLMIAASSGDDFLAYAAKTRAAHKPKRNLMKLLDQHSWER